MMNTKLYKKCCLSLFIIACVFVSSFAGISMTFASAPPSVSAAISAGLDYLNSVQSANGSIGGFMFSSWAVNAIVAAGEDPDAGRWANTSGYSVVDYLIDNKEVLDDVSEYDLPCNTERFFIAMTAAGEDPTNIDGVNYLSILKGFFDGTQIGVESKLNDDFWGIIALVSAGEPTTSTEIQGSVAYIKDHQNNDGGWSWQVGDGTGSSDVDDTAAAIMALMCAGEDNNSQAIETALQYLKTKQDSSGGFLWGDEPNSASTAWAMEAIVSAGEHPAQWPLPGPSAVEFLLSLQNSDGSFNYTPDSDLNTIWMTSYAVQALCYNPYPVNVAPFTADLQGDFNDDNQIEFRDISIFVNTYIAYYEYDYVTVPEVDFNDDGIVDFADISRFVNYYIGYYT